MSSYNRVILVGNLGADPETRYFQSGTALTTWRMATSERFTNREGQKQEKTQWHNIKTTGKTAEVCGQYLAKGSPVLVEGQIEYRSYEDREGQTKWVTEINARSVQFLGKGQQRHSEAPQQHSPEPHTPTPTPGKMSREDASRAYASKGEPDDYPF